MCNLYSNTTTQQAMRQLFEVAPDRDRLGSVSPQPAISPKYSAPVVRRADDGERELISMHWGFLAAQTSREAGKPNAPAAHNVAASDSLQKSSLWKDSFLNRRCLVPANSFCEAKGQAPATDVWFALVGGEPRPPFAFAGLWRDFQPGLPDELSKVMTHTVITTTANEIVRPVQPDRMPVILTPDDYEAWLSGSPGDAFSLLRPYPVEQLQIVLYGIAEQQDPGG